MVVVLDASYSMDYRQADATRFDAAKRLAGELVQDSLQGDGFSLILLATPPRVVVGDPVFDREDLAGEIAELRRTDGGADLAATLAEIERVLDRAARREPRLRQRRVCFFTDLGRTTWGDVSPARNAVDADTPGEQGRPAAGRRGATRWTERGRDACGRGRWRGHGRPSHAHRH